MDSGSKRRGSILINPFLTNALIALYEIVELILDIGKEGSSSLIFSHASLCFKGKVSSSKVGCKRIIKFTVRGLSL
ncbi:MAG: hypothetical protein BWX46_00322 [Candidatus Cloacimonetes bacterium ADurb.Bin003]|nr:MAG: hypothetical protein BWX46_00322 [Candidatus Cloacimonetes bacterium ADurb.Bin003]